MADQDSAIGVDVGGTKIAAAVVRFPFAVVVARDQMATRPDRGADAVLADVVAVVARLRDAARAAGLAPAAVGIGLPELVDVTHRIVSGATVDWRGRDLGRSFPGLRVAVDADVRLAARAEALFGAGRGLGVFVYVSIGTGISSTLVQHGRPFIGARGHALVLASGKGLSDCPACGHRDETVLEEIGSGLGLARTYARLRPGAAATTADVLARAGGGEPDALGVVTRGAEAVGNRIGWLVNALDPEAVVIGGGLGCAAGPYRERLEQAARDAIWLPETKRLPILTAALGADAGAIGAAALVIDGMA